MIFNIKNRLNAGFASAILLVLLIGIISFFTLQKQHKEADLVKHTSKVIHHLDLLQNLLVGMETGRRGFRSTNEKKFLEPYYRGLRNLPPLVEELRRLVSDNPAQLKRTEALIYEINSLSDFWKNLGDDASTYTRERITGITTVEKEKMDKIRLQLEEISKSEENLLLKRENENQRFVKLAKLELAVGLLLILCVVILLIIQVLKELGNRKVAEESVKNSYKELSLLNHENAERNWLLVGLSDVNDILQGHLNIDTLSQVVLDTIIKYLDLRAGAFYVYNEERNRLVLTASYALPGSAKKEYQLHEGFVGQAAVAKEPLIISDIPPKYATVDGATVLVEPVQAIYASLIHQGELKGIIEVLSFNAIGEKNLKFLKIITNNIAVAINEVQTRSKRRDLLKQVQEQKEALEHQQEELKQTNEELTVQAEVLQASEEELKVQEEELRQINAELKEKNQAVETARQALSLKAKELELSSKFKSEFLANMSHELRTPLNSVLILAKLLADNRGHNLTEKQVAHAKIIHKSGSDLLELINDILDLSKIEAGKVEVHLDEVAIKNVATDMEHLFTSVAEEKGIHYSIIIQPGVPEIIETDKQKVEQVLKNLLSNAFKFTPRNGNITLEFREVAENGNYVAMSVSDNGIGIPPAKQQIIFEAFQQADGSTNRRFGGTGLGLSISKELVRLLSGKIELKSEENKGSSFTIYIPVKSMHEEVAIIQDTQERETSFLGKITGQTRITDDRYKLEKDDNIMLIIEDDENFASLIKDFSSSHGYKTIVALSGDEGLDCARKYRPSAIILDMQLPVIDGLTLLKAFKQDPELKRIPVHIISANDDVKVTSSGALAFLKKPVEKEDLERAFTLIGEYLQSAVKRVMILSKNGLKDDIINSLVKEKNYDVACDIAASVNEAIGKLQQVKYDCIIADIGNNIEEGIAQLTILNGQILPKHIPTIIYLDEDISLSNELKLKKIGDVIVRKTLYSNNRLLDELELFLYKVQENNPPAVTPHIPASSGNISLVNKKVLLVDDDMRNIFALSAVLEQEQMEVIIANDGKEALHLLSQNNDIEIVLMDIMMPEMDGYEAMNYIRNNMKLTNLPIIALTAKAMAGDKEKCIKAGASDYISKPVDTQKLVSLMRIWLS